MTKENDLIALLCEIKSNLYQLIGAAKTLLHNAKDTDPMCMEFYNYALDKIDQSLEMVKVGLEILSKEKE